MVTLETTLCFAVSRKKVLEMLPSFSTETNSFTTNSIPKSDTIQNIAIKIIEEQIRLLNLENGPKERTIFFVGSKGAVSKKKYHFRKSYINLYFLGKNNSHKQILRPR